MVTLIVRSISHVTGNVYVGFQDVSTAHFAKPVHSTLSVVTKSVPQLLASFPLKDRDIRMACMECFKQTRRFGKSSYKYEAKLDRKCRMDIWIVRRNNTPDSEWAKIRPLPEFKETIPIKFSLCPKFLNGELCRFGESRCRFANYDDELLLWQQEKIYRRIGKRQAFEVGKFKDEFTWPLTEL